MFDDTHTHTNPSRRESIKQHSCPCSCNYLLAPYPTIWNTHVSTSHSTRVLLTLSPTFVMSTQPQSVIPSGTMSKQIDTDDARMSHLPPVITSSTHHPCASHRCCRRQHQAFWSMCLALLTLSLLLVVPSVLSKGMCFFFSISYLLLLTSELEI